MPFRCTNCQLLSKEDDNPKCETRKSCNFQRVEVIHLAHPNGIGRSVGNGTRSIIDEGKEATVAVPIKLCCTSTVQGAAFTTVRHAATCISCLEAIPVPEPTPEPTPKPDPET